MDDNEASADAELERVADRVADVLGSQAEQIVADWIDWLKRRVDTGTVGSLPDSALRNHIPPVLHAIARYVRVPLELVRNEVLGHLDLHGHIRWEQGYGIEELLAEFDGLAQLVSEAVVCELDQVSASPRAVAEVMRRVGTGLRSIGYVTVSIYRKTESEHQREIGRQLDEFARGISHEIRGPLNAAKPGVALLAKDEIATDERRRAEHVRIVQRSIGRALDLLDDVRVLAVAQSARSEGRQVDLRTAIQAIRDELRGAATDHDVEVRVEGDIPQVRVASVPLQIALMNLVGNAIKYCDRQKEHRWCRISAARHPRDHMLDSCEIVISDNGLGIPADMHQSVFQRHVRVPPEVADGTGLGLPITRQLLQQHGGTIDLQSVEGEGTSVRFSLPVVDNRRPGRYADDLQGTDLARIAYDEVSEDDSESVAGEEE
ncbi:MAG: HAMP domain-containing sensor histidine kinase [Bryobacterales bacterium]